MLSDNLRRVKARSAGLAVAAALMVVTLVPNARVLAASVAASYDNCVCLADSARASPVHQLRFNQPVCSSGQKHLQATGGTQTAAALSRKAQLIVNDFHDYLASGMPFRAIREYFTSLSGLLEKTSAAHPSARTYARKW